MGFLRAIVFLQMLFLAGCWDTDKSPLIKNMSGHRVEVQLIVDGGGGKGYVVEAGESLVLPNLTDKKKLVGVNLLSEGKASNFLEKEYIFENLRKRRQLFLIRENLSVESKPYY